MIESISPVFPYGLFSISDPSLKILERLYNYQDDLSSIMIYLKKIQGLIKGGMFMEDRFDWEKFPEDQVRRLGKVKPSSIIIGIFIGIIIIIILSSSFYTVNTDEAGVVKTFGAFSRITGPGIHTKWFWPIQTVEKVSVEKVNRIEIGFRTVGKDNAGNIIYSDIPEEKTMVTRDENIVEVEFIVQYIVRDPSAYLFNVDNPIETIRKTSWSAMRTVIAGNTVDDVLTIGKEAIQNQTKDLIQSVLDRYNCGVRVVAVQLQDVDPPAQVKSAFDEAQKAKEKMDQLVNEGKRYYNQVVLEAQGEAYKILKEAEAYKIQKINLAKGEVSRFEEVYRQYVKEKNITKKQIYLDRMRSILAGINKYIVDPSVNLNIFLQEGKTKVIK
jgi:membrane protease subunit HflK